MLRLDVLSVQFSILLQVRELSHRASPLDLRTPQLLSADRVDQVLQDQILLLQPCQANRQREA